MTETISIEIDDSSLKAALGRLGNAHQTIVVRALQEIGEKLQASTKARFETSTAPDGSTWAANSQTTYLRYLGSAKSLHAKDGRINGRGSAKVMGKKPLIGLTHSLATQIHWELTAAGLAVGSPMIYAAMQQFGGTTSPRSMFPNTKIPARPFLGISTDDGIMLLSVIERHLRAVVL